MAFFPSMAPRTAGPRLDQEPSGTVTSATFGTGSETADVPVPVIGVLVQQSFKPFFVELEVVETEPGL